MEIDTKELKKKATALYSRTTYALGHLDTTSEHGYNDKIAIENAIDAIDIIVTQLDELEYIKYIDKNKLLKWKSELKNAGKDDAYTSAIAQALNDIAKDINEVVNELSQNND